MSFCACTCMSTCNVCVPLNYTASNGDTLLCMVISLSTVTSVSLPGSIMSWRGSCRVDLGVDIYMCINLFLRLIINLTREILFLGDCRNTFGAFHQVSKFEKEFKIGDAVTCLDPCIEFHQLQFSCQRSMIVSSLQNCLMCGLATLCVKVICIS